MSVLIKDMEIPKTCEDCPLESFCSLWIDARRMSAEPHDRATIRHQDCPLLEIPPHGRLIDADALTISTAVPLDGKPYQYVHIDNIKAAPTIIPAEPPKEE